MDDSLDIYADACGTDSQDPPFLPADARLQPAIFISSPPESSPPPVPLKPTELHPPAPAPAAAAASAREAVKGGIDVVSQSPVVTGLKSLPHLKEGNLDKGGSTRKLPASASMRIPQPSGLADDAHLGGKNVLIGTRRGSEHGFGGIPGRNKKKKLASALAEDTSDQLGKDDIAINDNQEKSAFSVKLKKLPSILTNIMGLYKSANADIPEREQVLMKEKASIDNETAGCQEIPTDFLEVADFVCGITNRTSAIPENLDIIKIARRKGLQFPYVDDDSSCSEGFSP